MHELCDTYDAPGVQFAARGSRRAPHKFRVFTRALVKSVTGDLLDRAQAWTERSRAGRMQDGRHWMILEMTENAGADLQAARMG
jgi:hypothetical protein